MINQILTTYFVPLYVQYSIFVYGVVAMEVGGVILIATVKKEKLEHHS